MSQPGRRSLPPKLYFRIGEVASLIGVEPHVLRYWEREFRSIRPTKSAKGQRVYSRRDVENLLRVRDLLYTEGFTIAGAKKQLQRGGVEPRAGRDAQADLEVRAGRHAHDDQHPPDDQHPRDDLRANALQSHALSSSARPSNALPSSADPSGGPAVADDGPAKMRDALVALRGEIEAFLTDLG